MATGSETTAGARNNTSADLQNLAYASGLHDSVQRDNTQPNANQALSAGQSQHVSYPSSSYPSYSQQQQPRPKSVSSLAERSTKGSPAVGTHQPNYSGLPPPKTGYQASADSQSANVQQRATTLPQITNSYRTPPTVHQTSLQVPDHSNRALPNVTQSSQTVPTTAAYHWNNQETVDPTQVYDPWPEIQRKREAARAARALEERAQAERERLEREKAEKEAEEARKLEESRKAEEMRLAEERRKAEEAERAEQQRIEEERKKEADRVQQAQRAQEQRQKKANTKSKMSKPSAAAMASTTQAASSEVEAQMRALMAQMRQLNNQDPALLAKIWEEERRTHGQSNETAQAAAQSPTPTAQQPHKASALRKPSSTQPQPSPNKQGPATQAPPAPPPQQQQLHRPQPTQQQYVHQPPQKQPQQQPQAVAQPRRPAKRPLPTGTTSWPSDKKEQISKAASDWLNAIPENHDKQISPQEVCDLLNENPKYVDLCGWLEGQGMKLERGSFARALLAAVPDINKPNQTQAPLSVPVKGNTLAPPSTNAFKNPSQPGPHNNHPNYPNVPADRPTTVAEHLRGSQSPYPPPEHTSFRSPYFVPATTSAPAPAQQAIFTPPPQIPVAPMPYARHDRQNSGSRQGSLQREDSQKPASKADAARKRDFSEIVDLTQLSDDEEPPAKKQPGINNDIAPTWAAPPDSGFYTRPPESGSLYSLPTMVHIDDRTKNMDVVQPLNRKFALRRSTYEVKTIARDVLLATGKHPEMRPLNGHLEILKESFKKVDNTSDLSTLRWDLIDPGNPPPEAFKSDIIEIEDEDADDEEEDVPREQYHPQPTQPTTKPAPVNSASPASLRAIASPSAPPITSASTPTLKRRGPPPKFGVSGATDARDARATPPTIRDRERGRPSSSTIGTPQSQPPMATNSKSIGYSAFRETQYGPDGTPLPKKKGRPVGWRKSVHSKEAQARASGATLQPTSGPRPSVLRTSQASNGVVLINSRSPSVASPRKAPVSYSVYKCQWENCAAELHNMETLRKHVFKFHYTQNINRKWPCYWGACQENERFIDPRTGRPNGFSVSEDLKDHIEFAHLGPKSWELGDGHAGGLSESHDSASEAYLSDSRGRRVTPLIPTPSKEALELASAAAAPVPRGPGRPKLKTDEQKAKEAQAELEKKNRLVGPGIDRGGARLANDKRRMGFIDDEDFEDVVTDSK